MCAQEPRTPGMEAGVQLGFLPFEEWSVQSLLQCSFPSGTSAPPPPPYRCSTPSGFHRFSWSRMSVVCANTGLSLPAPEPGCHGVCSGEGGWVIVTEHFIHTYSLCFVEGNFPRLILKGIILLMHGVLIFVCFLTS